MKQIPSPNFTVGRNGHIPEAIVIHIMEGTLAGTDSWFSSTKSQVSAHYGVGKNGETHQYVADGNTAWHAGVVANPSWERAKEVNPNEITIGIEHEGRSTDEWTVEMKNASAELIKDICTRWNIPIDREHIIGHYEICSTTRPNCPSIDKEIIDELVSPATPIHTDLEIAPKTVGEVLVYEGMNKLIASSENPANISLFIKGLVAFGVLFGVDATVATDLGNNLVSLVLATGQVISIGMAVWGLIRKILNGRWS